MRRQTVGPFYSSQFSPLIFIPLCLKGVKKFKAALRPDFARTYILNLLGKDWLPTYMYSFTLNVTFDYCLRTTGYNLFSLVYFNLAFT